MTFMLWLKFCHDGECYMTYEIKNIYGFETLCAKPQSSVGMLQDLRTGGRSYDLRLGQYYFRGLMIAIATGSFLSQRCSSFPQWFRGKAANGLERILCGVLDKRTPETHG